MRSKPGNKLKKIRKLALAASLTLTGCILSPEHKTVIIHKDYSVGPDCLTPDTTTFTDSSEIHTVATCTVGDSTDPGPPKIQNPNPERR